MEMRYDESNAFFINTEKWRNGIDALDKSISKAKEDKMVLYDLIKNQSFCRDIMVLASNIIHNDKYQKTLHELQLEMMEKILELNEVCRSYNIYNNDLLPLPLDLESHLKDIRTRYSNK